MNADKREYLINLYNILQTNEPGVLIDGWGKTTTKITSMYNDKHNDRKSKREIAATLTHFARNGIARKKIINGETRWAITSKDIFDLLYE